MVKNTYGIGSISLSPTAKCYCPLGKDWYTNNFTVTFVPGEFIPDYCEVDKWIDENINGKELIIEAAVAALYDYLHDTYSPDKLVVSSQVKDAKHSPVQVAKGGFYVC